MNKKTLESNSYTLIFAIVLVIVVGALLSFTAFSLKDRISANKRNEKRVNILESMGVESTMEQSEADYQKYITSTFAVDINGNKKEGVDAFALELKKEMKKDKSEQSFPVYVGEKKGKTYTIIPLRGNGLWDAIWGYVALNDDLTVAGAVFDHKGETPGLGAEIKQSYFTDRFKGETILDAAKNFKGITVLKGNEDPQNKDKTDNEVDAIAGATITCDGVTSMVVERLGNYMNYFNSKK